jgi:ATP-dependent DNA ligase
VFLYAFDLLELNGDDLRREPLERRKAAPEKLLVCGILETLAVWSAGAGGHPECSIPRSKRGRP